MKINKRLIYILLWMLLIFVFSHTSGEKSSEQSGLLLKLLEIFSITVPEKYLEIVSFLIRKIAHITEYFVLTYLILKYTSELKVKEYLFYSSLVAFLYACSDEFHQTFIPGRAGLITDVLVDSIGIFLALVIWKQFRNREGK